LFFAAPLSGLPSEPIALGAHAYRLHFVMKLVFAAPASALPSLPTALLSQVPGACAAAEAMENAVSNSASINRVIVLSPSLETRAHARRRHDALSGGKNTAASPPAQPRAGFSRRFSATSFARAGRTLSFPRQAASDRFRTGSAAASRTAFAASWAPCMILCPSSFV